MRLRLTLAPAMAVTASGSPSASARVRLTRESRDGLVRGLDFEQRAALLLRLLDGPRPPGRLQWAARRAVESAVLASLGAYGPEVVDRWLRRQDEQRPTAAQHAQLGALAARAKGGLDGLAALARGEPRAAA
jgi:hypothetical protein